MEKNFLDDMGNEKEDFGHEFFLKEISWNFIKPIMNCL